MRGKTTSGVCELSAADAEWLEGVWRLHGPALRRYAESKSVPGVDADDLVQEAFLRVLRVAHRLRDEARLGPFLRNAVDWAAKDAARRAKHRASTVPLETDVPSVEWDHQLLSDLGLPDPDRCVRAVVPKLADRQRQLWEEAVRCDFDSEQMAQAMYDRMRGKKTLDECKHLLRSQFESFRRSFWNKLGLYPEVQALLAYERDPNFEDHPLPAWRQQLVAKAEDIALGRAIPGSRGPWAETAIGILQPKDQFEPPRCRGIRLTHWGNALLVSYPTEIWAITSQLNLLPEKPLCCTGRLWELAALTNYDIGMQCVAVRPDHFEARGFFSNCLYCLGRALEIYELRKLDRHIPRLVDHYERVANLREKKYEASDPYDVWPVRSP